MSVSLPAGQLVSVANELFASEDPASIKMSNQHAKLARSEEPAPTKLNDEHDTHAVPVCALIPAAQSPRPRHARPRRAPRAMLGSYSRRLPVTRETLLT